MEQNLNNVIIIWIDNFIVQFPESTDELKK